MEDRGHDKAAWPGCQMSTLNHKSQVYQAPRRDSTHNLHCEIGIIANNYVHLRWELPKQIGNIIHTNIMEGWQTSSHVSLSVPHARGQFVLF